MKFIVLVLQLQFKYTELLKVLKLPTSLPEHLLEEKQAGIKVGRNERAWKVLDESGELGTHPNLFVEMKLPRVWLATCG